MLIKHFNQLARIDQWIRQRGTGELDFMAKRLGMSKRSVSNRLQALRELGAKIKYDSHRSSYYYEEEFNFKEKWGEQFK